MAGNKKPTPKKRKVAMGGRGQKSSKARKTQRG